MTWIHVEDAWTRMVAATGFVEKQGIPHTCGEIPKGLENGKADMEWT